MKEFFESPPRSVSRELKMQALFFHGETEAWRRERYLYNHETIRVLELLPIAYDGEDHSVGWLERSIVDPDTNERQVHYHAACKCIAYAEDEDSSAPMFVRDCHVWQEGVLQKAEQERDRTKIVLGEMLGISLLLDVSSPLESLDPQDEAIMLELKRVDANLARWVGNATGGTHEIPLLSVVTGCPEDELAERAHRLSEKGMVKIYGEQTLRLAA